MRATCFRTGGTTKVSFSL